MKRLKPGEAAEGTSLQRPWRIVAIGGVVGVVVSLTSIGSGSGTLPLLAFAFLGYACGA